jgi:succinyl-CoA:acetate CoA-transferase
MPPYENERNNRFIENIEDYKKSIILRPLNITNSHEVIRRLGVISMNQAVEIDIYGFVNSTHILQGNVINGIGGSAEFARDAYLSIFLLPSIMREGKISRIVPIVTHVDTVDHDVDIVVTEQGWADLRGKSPVERAREIIERCVHPDYKAELSNYLEKAIRKVGGHMPHLLDQAFSWHLRYMETQSMKPSPI